MLGGLTENLSPALAVTRMMLSAITCRRTFFAGPSGRVSTTPSAVRSTWASGWICSATVDVVDGVSLLFLEHACNRATDASPMMQPLMICLVFSIVSFPRYCREPRRLPALSCPDIQRLLRY